MSKLLCVFVFLISTNLYANTKKEQIRLLKCIRHTIDERRLDYASIEKTYLLLKEYNQENTAELIAQCQQNQKEFKRENKKTNYMMLNKHLDDFKRRHNIQEDKSTKILTKFIQNKNRCHTIGATIDISIAMGAGIGIHLGACLGENGRRWAIVAPNVALNYGVGASVVIQPSTFVISRKHIGYIDGQVGTLGVLLVKRETSWSDSLGVGVGLSLMASEQRGLAFKLIPIGQNFDDLLTDLNSD